MPVNSGWFRRNIGALALADRAQAGCDMHDLSGNQPAPDTGLVAIAYPKTEKGAVAEIQFGVPVAGP